MQHILAKNLEMNLFDLGHQTYFMLNGMYINNIVKINDNEYKVFYANGRTEIVSALTKIQIVETK